MNYYGIKTELFFQKNVSPYACISMEFLEDNTIHVNGTSSSDTTSTSLNTNNYYIIQQETRMVVQEQMPNVKSIVISSNSMLLHLKSKIMEIFCIVPNNQYLKTPDGIELLNNEATMEDLNILPNSVILARFEENVIIQKQEVVTAEEIGFKGTELMS